MLKRSTILLLLLVLASQASFARRDDDDDDGKKKGKARRSEFGINYAMTNSAFYYRYKEFYNGRTSVDTSITLKIKSKGGFGFSLGGFIPIAPASTATNMLALNMTGMFNMITWDVSSIADGDFDEGSVFYDDGIVSSTMVMAFLMGLDFKHGCDANLDKGQKFCFTMGAGGGPFMTLTQFGGIPAGASFGLKPYAKVELGMMAGICMKLRVLYTIGEINYMSYNDKTSSYQESLYFTDKMNLTVSLVLMPLSMKWEKKDKWDR